LGGKALRGEKSVKFWW